MDLARRKVLKGLAGFLGWGGLVKLRGGHSSEEFQVFVEEMGWWDRPLQITLSPGLAAALAKFELVPPNELSEVQIARVFELALEGRGATPDTAPDLFGAIGDVYQSKFGWRCGL